MPTSEDLAQPEAGGTPPVAQPNPDPGPRPDAGVDVGIGVGAGVHGAPLGVGSGTRVGAGDDTGVLGGTNVGVGVAGDRDGAGEAVAPVNWVQSVPFQAQSSSDTGTAGDCDAGLDDRLIVVGSPPNSSSFPDTPS